MPELRSVGVPGIGARQRAAAAATAARGARIRKAGRILRAQASPAAQAARTTSATATRVFRKPKWGITAPGIAQAAAAAPPRSAPQRRPRTPAPARDPDSPE